MLGGSKANLVNITTTQTPVMCSRTKMVQDHAHIRQQGAQDFLAYYDYACARQGSISLPAVKTNLDKGMLDFNGDRVKFIDWPPILNSISINKHLHCIAISSTNHTRRRSADSERKYYKSSLRKKIPAICSKDITFKLCKALRDCLTVSSNLKSLQLNGLPLRARDLITLTKGLASNVSLENLSLANCPISDEGLEVICQSVKYSASIRTIDFTGCNLTWRGAEHMANIIKHQAMQRHGTAWAESLRYQQPQFEGMRGLRRVTLNCNSLIGDQGAAALAHELAEDLWVKAVDLQRCGLSREGARRLLEALKTNSSLVVLDIRSNPLVDKVLIKTVIEKVLMNANGQSSEYCWIKPAAIEPQRDSCLKRRVLPSAVRGNVTFRIDPLKGTPPGGRGSGVATTHKPYSRSRYVPWRAAARAGRQRGMAPGVSVTNQCLQDAATVKVTLESDSEGEEDEEDVVVEVEQRPSSLRLQDRITGRHIEYMQVALKECRLQQTEERRARLKAESRLMEVELENARLRDTLSKALEAPGCASALPFQSALEDEAVLQSIESSFTKFHAFLDLLSDAGLGQLASMAGIDKSDFQSLGQPQLSSTIGPHMGRMASLTRTRCHDVGTKTDCSLLSNVLPAPPGRAADATTSRSLSSVKESLRHDMLLDGTFNQASGPALDPGVNEAGKPDETSFRSLNSSENVNFCKTPSGSSHRSIGSHGEWSGRSSISEISDQAESAGSVRSWYKAKGKLVTLGQTGPEGSDNSGSETVGQMRSLGSFGGQSDNKSL